MKRETRYKLDDRLSVTVDENREDPLKLIQDNHSSFIYLDVEKFKQIQSILEEEGLL